MRKLFLDGSLGPLQAGQGARAGAEAVGLHAEALEHGSVEIAEGHADLTDETGRRRIVRHGYLPERKIQTGIGSVAVRAPRVRDRGAVLPCCAGFCEGVLRQSLLRDRQEITSAFECPIAPHL